MPEIEFEEEEFSTEVNRRTIFRILSLAKPHWIWLVGFLATIGMVSAIDAYLTYLGKAIIDDAILPADLIALKSIITRYGLLIIFQMAGVFGFIYLTGILG
jgi:ATP-binding cassette subfamily B protein